MKKKIYIYINQSRFLICKESSYIPKVYYSFWKINTVIIKQKQESLTGADHSCSHVLRHSQPIKLDVLSVLHVLRNKSVSTVTVSAVSQLLFLQELIHPLTV